MSEPHIDISAGAASGGGDGVETTGNNAAQGRRGTHTFKVLIASLVLVVVALFGLYALNHHSLSSNQGAGGQSGTNNPHAAAEFHQAPPSPKQAPPGMPSTEPAAAGAGESRAGNTAG